MQINPLRRVRLIWVNLILDGACSNMPNHRKNNETPMQTPNLSKQQIADLSRQLRTRYEVLRRRSAPWSADVATGAEVHDTKDAASAEVLDEVQAADQRRDATEMGDIEQALARMHAQTYGVCIDCGQAIGVERLQAYPTAKRCRRCQESRERRPRSGSSPGR